VRKHAKAIWAAAPIERVDISDLAGAKALARSRCLGRVRVLGLNWVGRSGLPALRELLGSPKLTNLRNLVAFSCGLGDAGAKVVAESPYLSRLEVAYLDCNEIGDEGAMAIAKSPHLTSLTHLDITRNFFGKRATKALRKRFPQCC
jgi:Ran GTPase-activating protein (RanGAP) involved in mRNA processing and transport